IKEKHNTPAVDVGEHTLISAHVLKYQPAALKPFDTVKTQVQRKVVAQLASDRAREEGAVALTSVRKSNTTAGFSPTIKVSRADTQGIPRQAVAAIFKADPHKLPAYVGVDLD